MIEDEIPTADPAPEHPYAQGKTFEIPMGKYEIVGVIGNKLAIKKEGQKGPHLFSAAEFTKLWQSR
jgi:hypothetical protein